jgi:hypothetical protein
VVRPEATGQGLAQLRELLAQSAAGQVGQHRRIGGASYQCHKHRATRYSQHVGRDAGELDAGILQHLVQPMGQELRALVGRNAARGRFTVNKMPPCELLCFREERHSEAPLDHEKMSAVRSLPVCCRWNQST